MNGRALAGLFGIVAVAVVGFGGWLLLRDDTDQELGRHPTHHPTQLPSPSPDALQPTVTPTKKPLHASPVPTSGPAVAVVQPTGPVSTDPAPARTEKVTSIKQGKGGGLVVLVQGSDGKPLAGAIVEAKTSKRTLPARSSGVSGEAAFDIVGADEGKVTGAVHHVRYPNAVAFTADARQGRVTVKLGADGATTATGFLVGSIRAAHGQAPPRAEISFFDDTGIVSVLPSESFAMWSANGQFRVELPAGSYSISASGPGFSESDKAYPTVEAGKDSRPVDLAVEAAGTISGRVDLPPEAGAKGTVPIGFDYVCINGTDENPNTTPRHVDLDVGTDGAFKLEGLAPGKYRVRASDGTHVSAWAPEQPTWLGEGGRMEGLILALAQDTAGRVHGTVKDHLGAPIAGATVKELATSAVTDSNGEFVVRGLDPGQHKLAIASDGCVTRFQTVVVPPAGAGSPGQIEAGVITLPRCGSATGVVNRAGKPANGISVLAVERGQGGAAVPHGPATTDSSGAWRLDGLSPGAYYLKIGNAGLFPDPKDPTFNVRSGEVVAVPPCEAPSE